jgi:hypothetical protein
MINFQLDLPERQYSFTKHKNHVQNLRETKMTGSPKGLGVEAISKMPLIHRSSPIVSQDRTARTRL